MDRHRRQRRHRTRAFQDPTGWRIASPLGRRASTQSSLVAGWKPDRICRYECAYLRSASGRTSGRNQRQIARDHLAALGRARPLLAGWQKSDLHAGTARIAGLWLLDLASMKSRPLTKVQNRAAMRTFDVTSDGKQIVFDRLRENSQVIMIDLPKE